MIGRPGYRPFSWDRGLLHVNGDLANVRRPHLRHGLEQGYVALTLEWADNCTDPLVAVTLDVTHTWLGRALLAAAIRWDNRSSR